MSYINSSWVKENLSLLFFLTVEVAALVLAIVWLIIITVSQ